MMEVSEKCTQRPAHRLPGFCAPIPSVALDVADHVLLADPAEVAAPVRAYLKQEPADERLMADDGLRRQAAFPSQIVAELLEYLVLRSDWQQRRRRDGARIAQHRQPPPQRRPVAGLDRLPPGSVPKVELNRALIEISQLAVASCDPPQQELSAISAVRPKIDRARLLQLAHDLPTAWNAPSTDT